MTKRTVAQLKAEMNAIPYTDLGDIADEFDLTLDDLARLQFDFLHDGQLYRRPTWYRPSDRTGESEWVRSRMIEHSHAIVSALRDAA